MDGLLKSMSSDQLETWKVYEELEPFPDRQASWNAAHIVQYLWALRGDPERRFPQGRHTDEFRMRFGDEVLLIPPKQEVKQTIEFQEMLIDGWIASHNMQLELKAKQHGS